MLRQTGLRDFTNISHTSPSIYQAYRIQVLFYKCHCIGLVCTSVCALYFSNPAVSDGIAIALSDVINNLNQPSEMTNFGLCVCENWLVFSQECILHFLGLLRALANIVGYLRCGRKKLKGRWNDYLIWTGDSKTVPFIHLMKSIFGIKHSQPRLYFSPVWRTL